MDLAKLLSLFHLKPLEISLFEILFYGEELRAGQLAKMVRISRASAYDLLAHLIDLGLVLETQKDGVKRFSAVSPEKIEWLLQEKESEIFASKKILEKIKESYQKKKKNIKPKFQLFEGRDAVQQMMKDMLLYQDLTVRAYWPIKKMIELLTPEFLEKFHRERVRQNIELKVIWPKEQLVYGKKYGFLQGGEKMKREIKISPEQGNSSLGYSIYGNTVRFISSSRENFGFLVESEELAETMKKQFEIIWKQAKNLPK